MQEITRIQNVTLTIEIQLLEEVQHIIIGLETHQTEDLLL